MTRTTNDERRTTNSPAPPNRGEAGLFVVRRASLVVRVAICLLVTALTYWVVQDGVQFNADALAAAARTFDEQIIPTTRRYFGQEPAVGPDGDPHVTVWYGAITGAGGYISIGDLYPKDAWPKSN